MNFRAPDFSFVDIAGKHHTLAEYRGRSFVLAFHDEWSDFSPSDKHPHVPILVSTDNELANRFGVTEGSAAFLIDNDGIVRWRHSTPCGGMSRRQFITLVVSAALAAALAPRASTAEIPPAAPAVSPEIPMVLQVNGKANHLSLDPRTTLLDALRETMHLTGSKKGCDHGQCGACTVHVDGRRVLACLTLAAMAQGKSVTTIEGLAQGSALHPMQQAFIEHDGFQCGYCTPGQVMSAVALLREPCGPADDDVRECMSGNICRCGAYVGIVAAVQSVRTASAQG